MNGTTIVRKPDVLWDIFGVEKPIIGMVHLRPLPGSPLYEGEDVEGIVEHALKDAESLKAGGVDGLQVENIMDLPYLKPEKVGHETVACMSVIAREVRKATGMPTGICCLANAVNQAIAIALASGGLWVRAAEWANAYIADEGYIEASAPEALRYRRAVRAESIRIFADVHVKHGSHFIISDRSIEEQALDVEFFLADAIIVSGTRTGAETPLERVEAVKRTVRLPVLVGSGLNPKNAVRLLGIADGAIVGTYFKKDGEWRNPVDEERVKNLMRIVKGLR